MWQDMVPSPCTTTRAYSTCKAIRGSLVGHRGVVLHVCWMSNRALRTYATRAADILWRSGETDSGDNAHRVIKIVVNRNLTQTFDEARISHMVSTCTSLQKTQCEGRSSERLGESHGSSPVTTTLLLNHFLVTQQVLFPCRHIGSWG